MDRFAVPDTNRMVPFNPFMPHRVMLVDLQAPTSEFTPDSAFNPGTRNQSRIAPVPTSESHDGNQAINEVIEPLYYSVPSSDLEQPSSSRNSQSPNAGNQVHYRIAEIPVPGHATYIMSTPLEYDSTSRRRNAQLSFPVSTAIHQMVQITAEPTYHTGMSQGHAGHDSNNSSRNSQVPRTRSPVIIETAPRPAEPAYRTSMFAPHEDPDDDNNSRNSLSPPSDDDDDIIILDSSDPIFQTFSFRHSSEAAPFNHALEDEIVLRQQRIEENTVEYKYETKDFKHGTAEEELLDECIICFSKFVEEETLRRLPCMHAFHKDCVDKWLSVKSTCPLCRGDIIKMMKNSQFSR